MNDLPTLLRERADRAVLVPVDLAVITAAGERRVRRRRLAGYGAGLACAGVLATSALLGGGDGANRALDPAAPAPTTGASWFLDGRLHHDGTSTDLGIDVATYVRTSVGFVLVDTDDVVWSWTGSGEPVRVGLAADGPQRLAADAEGVRAAWVDGSDGEARVVVLHQPSGEVLGLVGTADREAFVTAVEGSRVWWRDGAASLSFAIGNRDTDRLPDETTVLASQGDRIVYEVDTEIRTSVGARSAYTVLDDSYRDVGALSTDGELWSADDEQVGVVRTSDGEPVPLDLDAAFSTGYGWLDEDSLLVLAGDGDPDDGGAMTARILVCEVPDGGCTDVSGELGTFEDLEAGDFALPVGVEVG